MLTTLKATVQGDRIHWLEESQGTFPPNREVQALIIPLDENPGGLSPEEKGQRRVAALKNLAKLGAFAGIQDPAAWQREVRTDRDLPDRER